MTHPRSEAVKEFRDESAQSRAAALVQRLQLTDLAAGREPVESRTIREVEARREQMRRVTEAVRR